MNHPRVHQPTPQAPTLHRRCSIPTRLVNVTSISPTMLPIRSSSVNGTFNATRYRPTHATSCSTLPTSTPSRSRPPVPTHLCTRHCSCTEYSHNHRRTHGRTHTRHRVNHMRTQSLSHTNKSLSRTTNAATGIRGMRAFPVPWRGLCGPCCTNPKCKKTTLAEPPKGGTVTAVTTAAQSTSRQHTHLDLCSGRLPSQHTPLYRTTHGTWGGLP